MIKCLHVKTFKMLFVSISALLITQGTISCSMLEENQESFLKLTEADPSDITIQQLMEKMQEATDPKGVFKNAKSYIMRQEVISIKDVEKGQDRDVYSMEIKYKTPDLMRTTSMRGGIAFSILVFNGNKAFYMVPGTTKVTYIPEGMGLNMVRAFSDMIRPGTNIAGIFQKVELGIVYEGKNKFYRLICRIADENIAPYIFYIDAETYLTRRMETILYAQDGSKYLYSAVSEDYKWISNVKMAVVSIITTGTQKDVSTIKEFILNPEIPASDFEPPTPFSHTLK